VVALYSFRAAVDNFVTASGHQGKNLSPAHQHNLHMTYREILASSSQTARSRAFSHLVATLPEEDLEYLDRLVARDLCQALEEIGFDTYQRIELANPV
jgi:hypothetical protein